MAYLKHKFPKIPIFFLPEFLVVCSVGNMVERLPVIHQRIHTALQTASSIILQSSTYTQSFESISGVTVTENVDIVSYLYYLEDQNIFNSANPQMLYEHLFKTLNDIRNVFCWRIDYACLGTISMMIPVIFLCIMAMLQLMQQNYQKNTVSLVLFLIQAGFILFTITWNNGALICGMFIWLSEFILKSIFILRPDATA